MELFRSEQYYIFVRNESSLWWHRFTGAFSVRSAWDLSDAEDIECLGITEGIVGLVEYSNILESHLMIIKESIPIGQLYFHHTIHKIKSICLLNMGATNQELDLAPCTKHGTNLASSSKAPKKTGSRLFESSAFLNKTVGAVKTVSNSIKTTTQQAATQVKHSVSKQRDPKDSERFEKRLIDELHKMFDDSDSFYYSRTLDITNSLQRQYDTEKVLLAEDGSKAVTDITRWWKHCDDRFFWNKHMLKDVIALELKLKATLKLKPAQTHAVTCQLGDIPEAGVWASLNFKVTFNIRGPKCDEWVLPIIQGYVQLAQIPVEPVDANPLNTESLNNASSCDETFTLGLISRRSRYQAGTRYNRRGVAPDGRVANYVETEQIVSIICSNTIHRASFIQVRGSVPIFWSQPDYKFRPPPILDRTEEESHTAFKKHFERELSTYTSVCVVNLVERSGRERVIWDAYSGHVLKYNDPRLVYTTFDFHDYCRGMRYENVSILINALAEIITDMRFCWRDEKGLICGQNGVFRVNCIDCLDRTNVVQTAIAKLVLELQLCRLGLGTPGMGLPPVLRHAFLTLWADNGDIISRQYAGTKALKGDYTRTGERKFSGLMKDGVASANRYYLSTFKDALRQMAIDVMTGETRTIPERLMEDTTHVKAEQAAADTVAMAQHVKQLIDDCKKLLIDNETVLGAWGLIDADPYTGDPAETDVDVVLLLTQTAVHVADYDETSDRITSVRRVSLHCLTALQAAPSDNTNTNIFALGRKASPEGTYCIRIHYQHNGEDGYFFTFRSTTLRFFNNLALAIENKDEMIESLHSICESIMAARDVAKLPPIPFQTGLKMDKKKSKVVPSEKQAGSRSSVYLDLASLPTLTRNVSETQLVTDLKSVGSKALNNMSEQFSKLNRFGSRAKPSLQLKFDQGTSRTKRMFTLSGGGVARPDGLRKKPGSLSDGMSSDYSSDDDNRTNIFEPTLDNFENSQVYIGKGVKKPENENDCELIENPLYSSKIEPNEPQTEDKTEATPKPNLEIQKTLKTPTSIKKNPFNMDQEIPINISESKTPEIHISPEAVANNFSANQKLQHSSSDINLENLNLEGVSYHVRSNSQHDVSLNIQQSHSESALRQLKNIASPVSTATRDLMLSPLSKVAKGVQSLGAHLDPRKIKGSGGGGSTAVKTISEQQCEEHKKLQEKWRDCNTRLIAL